MRSCRLCGAPSQVVFRDTRQFFACNTCGLIFTDCPIPESEIIKHYSDQYLNEFNWGKEVQYMINFFPSTDKNLNILDYGSGSGLMANELRLIGYDAKCYEPMIDGAFNSSAHYGLYDLIILNEVIEHVDNLREALDNIYFSLKSGGHILIKTLPTDKILNDPFNFDNNFKAWWYKDDLTHISFFCSLTFEYICDKLFPELEIVGENLSPILLHKK